MFGLQPRAGVLAIVVTGLIVPAGASAAVRPGHNVTVFHTIDFVATFGLATGQPAQVDVFRGTGPGIRIATARGPAVDTPDGGGLEVNHGPVGAPQPGDCWSRLTPNILPGDRVVVSDATGSDEVIVDAINIDSVASVGTDVFVHGTAFDAAGAPIPIAGLAGEVRGDAGKYRANPTSIAEDVGGAGTWVATYSLPYPAFRNINGLDDAQAKQAIIDGDHDMGYGHVAPLPAVTQLGTFNIATPNGNGPALGCEGSPQQDNAVSVSEDDVVSQSSGNLIVSGTAAGGVGTVGVTLSNGDVSVPVDASASLTGGGAGQGWMAEFTRAQLNLLADGTLTATATFDNGAPATDALTIPKDTIGPLAPLSSLASGTYVGARNVTLSSPEPGLQVHFTQNGSTPTAASPVFTTPIAVPSARTIKALAIDAAGNVGEVATFNYTIVDPAPAPAGGETPATPNVLTPPALRPALAATGLRIASRLRLRTARRAGVIATFVAPAGAAAARIVLRTAAGRTLGSEQLRIGGPGRRTVRLSSRALRRALRTGRYVIEVQVGRTATSLGPAAVKQFRIVR